MLCNAAIIANIEVIKIAEKINIQNVGLLQIWSHNGNFAVCCNVAASYNFAPVAVQSLLVFLGHRLLRN